MNWFIYFYKRNNNIKNIEKKSKEGYTNWKIRQEGVFVWNNWIASNQNQTFKQIYGIYKLRWKIEVNVKLEKSTVNNNTIHVHLMASLLWVRFLIQIEMILIVGYILN